MTFVAPLFSFILLLLFTSSAFAQDGCINNTNLIFSLESLVTNTMVRREYVLCNNTMFQMGFAGANGITGGQFPIIVRANATVKCGSDGRVENQCNLTGGSYGALLQPVDPMAAFDSIDGTIFEGITFFDLFEGAFVTAAVYGETLIKNCWFYDSVTEPNIVIAGVNLQQRRRRLKIRSTDPDPNSEELQEAHRRALQGGNLPRVKGVFSGCLFENNRAPQNFLSDAGNALIFMGFPDVDIRVENSIFRNNDFSRSLVKEAGQRALIVNFFDDNKLELVGNCFVNNQAYRFGLVNIFGNATISVTEAVGNFVTPIDPARTCSFIQGIDFVNNAFTPTDCIDFDVSVCLPFLGPTATPTKSPSLSPSATEMPSNAPITPMPTPVPTTSAPVTPMPTLSPVTAAPTTAPPTSSATAIKMGLVAIAATILVWC